jgi:hypothetical protein
MLISSGGIRDLPSAVVRRFVRPDDGGYDVEGMAELVLQTQATGRSFSRCGAAWAIDGEAVAAGELERVDFSSDALEGTCLAR